MRIPFFVYFRSLLALVMNHDIPSSKFFSSLLYHAQHIVVLLRIRYISSAFSMQFECAIASG